MFKPIQDRLFSFGESLHPLSFHEPIRGCYAKNDAAGGTGGSGDWFYGLNSRRETVLIGDNKTKRVSDIIPSDFQNAFTIAVKQMYSRSAPYTRGSSSGSSSTQIEQTIQSIPVILGAWRAYTDDDASFGFTLINKSSDAQSIVVVTFVDRSDVETLRSIEIAKPGDEAISISVRLENSYVFQFGDNEPFRVGALDLWGFR